MIKIGKNRIVALLVIAFGIFVLYQTSQIKSIFAISNKDVGPRMFPYFAATCLTACGVMKFITAKESEKYIPFFNKRGWIKVLSLFAAFAAYLVAMKYVGFLISTPFMAFVLVMIIADQRKINKIVALVYSLLLTGFIYFIFHNLMHIMLPQGLLFR